MMADSVNKNVEVSLGVVSCRKTAVGVKGPSVLSSKLQRPPALLGPVYPKHNWPLAKSSYWRKRQKKPTNVAIVRRDFSVTTHRRCELGVNLSERSDCLPHSYASFVFLFSA